MLIKRLLLVVISLIIGAILTYLIITLLLGTTYGEYGFLYFFLTTFFFAAGIGIWLDKFMDTDLLPE